MDDYSVLKERAFEILKDNIKEGYSKGLKRDYFYVSPDKVHYHQWFWDSCFHSIVMSNFNGDYAKREIETLLSVQCENGFIPHIIFWKWRFRDKFQRWWKKEVDENISKFFTTEVQPPVIGISLRKIFENTGDINFIKRNIEKVEKFYRYLKNERDPDNDNLISIITPMESGMDVSPQYDLPFSNLEHNPSLTKISITKMLHKYKKWRWDIRKIFEYSLFDVEDVSFNTIYCMGLESLSELYSHIDRKKQQEIGEWASEVRNAIIKKFWDEEDCIYYSMFHRNDNEYNMRIKTISSLFPLTLDIPDEHKNHLIEHLTGDGEFWTDYPIPSVSVDESSFGPLTNTRYIWRGTTWINTNWFLAEGLLKHGYNEIYEELIKRTLQLIPKYGFCEYYDPYTGKPGKAMRDFGWTTLIVEFID